jgi:glycerol kinase
VHAAMRSVVATCCRDVCRKLQRTHGKDHLRSITGLPFSTYFCAVKVKWMYENVKEVRAAMDEDDALIGTIDSWLIYNLTGGVDPGLHVTDGAQTPRPSAKAERLGLSRTHVCSARVAACH